MQGFTVVVAQADCVVAEHLAANLHAHFKNVVIARDLEEICRHIQKDCADIVIIDLDLTELLEMRRLLEQFRSVGLVCTHRAPDEAMWKSCLEMGALDCCSCGDIQGILAAARRFNHAAAAA